MFLTNVRLFIIIGVYKAFFNWWLTGIQAGNRFVFDIKYRSSKFSDFFYFTAYVTDISQVNLCKFVSWQISSWYTKPNLLIFMDYMNDQPFFQSFWFFMQVHTTYIDNFHSMRYSTEFSFSAVFYWISVQTEILMS